MAVAHAVEAREIGRGLGGGDDVIDADRVLGVRQRDLDDLRAERFVVRDRGAHGGVHLRIDASMKYSCGMPSCTPFRSRPSSAV